MPWPKKQVAPPRGHGKIGKPPGVCGKWGEAPMCVGNSESPPPPKWSLDYQQLSRRQFLDLTGRTREQEYGDMPFCDTKVLLRFVAQHRPGRQFEPKIKQPIVMIGCLPRIFTWEKDTSRILIVIGGLLSFSTGVPLRRSPLQLLRRAFFWEMGLTYHPTNPSHADAHQVQAVLPRA